MATGLLGYWPGEATTSVSTISSREEAAVLRKQGTAHEFTSFRDDAAVRSLPTSKKSIPSFEIYYDTLSVPITIFKEQVCVPYSSSNATVDRAPMEPEKIGDIEWQKMQPPKELFDVPYGTPLEIESIIIASVERLQQQFMEEQSTGENHTVVQDPKENIVEQEVPEVEVVPPIELRGFLTERTPRPYSSVADCNKNYPSRDGQRNSDASITTTYSGDSGYVSTSPETNSIKGRLSGFFRFSSSSKDNQDTSKRHVSECVSCLEDFQPRDLIPLTCHSYCAPCFKTLISTALSSEESWPPKCCQTPIKSEVLLPHLSQKDRKKYREVLEERSVPAGERIYCSKTTCNAWVPPQNIHKDINCAACISCRQKTCTVCRGIFHATGECPRDPNLQATLQVANDEGWRRCFSCSALVEHNQGCIHMTCRCKAQFCYICGSRWRTCSCSDFELQRVQQAATNRRLAAEFTEREAENRANAAVAAAEAEAAEMREILRQIEQFELQETERHAREEEELRLVAIESRQRAEEERIMAISRRYFDLRNDLEFLHALQTVAMSERHEEARQELKQQDKTCKTIAARQFMAIQVAEAVAGAEISDSQFHFDNEYQIRRSKERDIEDKYVAELQAYWQNRPGGEEKIVEGREKLRKAHQESYQRWDVTRRTKHRQVLETAMETVAKLRAKHEIERAVATGKRDKREDEMVAGQKVDVRWVQGVTEVRIQMLEAMEMEEYALEG